MICHKTKPNQFGSIFLIYLFIISDIFLLFVFQWRWPGYVFVMYRLGISLFTVTSLIDYLLMTSQNSELEHNIFVYLTTWTYLLLVLYAVTSAATAAYFYWLRQIRKFDPTWTPASKFTSVTNLLAASPSIHTTSSGFVLAPMTPAASACPTSPTTKISESTLTTTTNTTTTTPKVPRRNRNSKTHSKLVLETDPRCLIIPPPPQFDTGIYTKVPNEPDVEVCYYKETDLRRLSEFQDKTRHDHEEISYSLSSATAARAARATPNQTPVRTHVFSTESHHEPLSFLNPTFSRDEVSTKWYFQLCWLLYEILFVAAILVSLAYVSAIFPKLKDSQWQYHGVSLADLSVHCINSILLLLEVFVCAYPVRLLHAIYPMLYACIYTVFSLAYWSCNTEQNVLYPGVLDWNHPGLTASFVALLVCLIIPAFHIIHFILYHFRLFLYKKIYKEDYLFILWKEEKQKYFSCIELIQLM